MTQKYEEIVVVRVPKGTREALHRIAEKRYLALSTVARTAIMKEIEEERRKIPKAAA
jgi:predicted transcriptional regulator